MGSGKCGGGASLGRLDMASPGPPRCPVCSSWNDSVSHSVPEECAGLADSAPEPRLRRRSSSRMAAPTRSDAPARPMQMPTITPVPWSLPDADCSGMAGSAAGCLPSQLILGSLCSSRQQVPKLCTECSMTEDQHHSRLPWPQAHKSAVRCFGSMPDWV
jgi:hypothetical protein